MSEIYPELNEVPQVHKIYDEDFEETTAYAHGSFVGHLMAHQQTPYMTAALKDALEMAYAIAFNAGYALARRHAEEER